MTASINLQKVQVFIKESHKKMKNQFILQRINQPALGLDQISLDATINIPQSDEDEVNKVPSVEVNVDINELSQRLDVTLMRLIVRVSNQKSQNFVIMIDYELSTTHSTALMLLNLKKKHIFLASSTTLKILNGRYPINSTSKRCSRFNHEG